MACKAVVQCAVLRILYWLMSKYSFPADLKGRLHSLDARLAVQSTELDQMRERLRQAEADRNEAILRTRWLEEQQQESERHHWMTPRVSRRNTNEVMMCRCMCVCVDVYGL